MPRSLLAFLLVVLAACSPPEETEPTSLILIDGTWSDWEQQEALADDAGDRPADTLDLGRLWAANDARFLFVAFETGDTLSLQGGNDLRLLVDADADVSTGLDTAGLGAELVWHFGGRRGLVALGDSAQTVRHVDLGLVTAPTVTSDRFEIALRRAAQVGGQPLFPSDTVRLALLGDGDRLPKTGAVTYVFEQRERPPGPDVVIAPVDTQDLRVMSYNVLRDQLFGDSTAGAYRRILQALRPDLIGFQEIYDHSAEQTAARVAELLADAPGAWHVAKVHDNIAVSRWPIERVDSTDRNGVFLIDMEAAYGTDLLFVVAHTPCCDRDAERQAEIDAIMAYVRDAIQELPEGTPVVVAGDMNLVGDARQVATLRTGDIVNEPIYGPDFVPDWDDTPLADLAPRTTGLPMNVTWYDPGSSFGPGRLDAVFYTDAVLDLTGSFVLFTPGLASEQLDRLGLRSDDTLVASDHLPLVADFEVRATD